MNQAEFLHDDIFMERCLKLAELGAGYTAPNPLVGAVLVHEGRIIGEGYHKQYGAAACRSELYRIGKRC